MFPLPEYLPLLVHGGEDVVESRRALGGAQHEQARGAERIGEQPEDAFLKLRLETEQEIAARDQVEPGEREVINEILRGEDHELANLVDDAIPSFVFLEESFEA